MIAHLLCFLLSLSFASTAIVTPICSDCSSVQQIFTETGCVMLLSDNTVIQIPFGAQNWTYVLRSYTYSIYQSPSNPNVLVFITNDGKNNIVLATSTSGGIGNLAYSTTVPLAYDDLENYSLLLHPTNSNTMVIIIGTPSSTAYAFFTLNLGKTWIEFNGSEGLINSTYAAWGNFSNLFFGIIRDESSRSVLAYTLDFGATWVAVANDAVAFYLTQNYMFVAVEFAEEQILYVSSSRNDPLHTDPRNYMPSQFLRGSEFQTLEIVLDTPNSAFVITNFNASASDANGALYSSQFNGAYYSLSLENVTVFSFVNTSLPGVYIAQQQIEDDTKQTLITYNSGGEWRNLLPPARDMYNNSWNCTFFCFLHLSTPIASVGGISIGTGNVGSYYYPLDESTFISSDGGITWSQVWNTSSCFAIGNSGGVLIFAPIMSGNIFYSTDYGVTWQELNLNVTISGIVVSSPSSLIFFILGKNFIIKLDFSDLFTTPCDRSDYGYFQPINPITNSSDCFLGALTVYYRRNPEVMCEDNMTGQTVAQKSCPCTWADYECAPGLLPSIRNDTDGFVCSSVFGYYPCGYQLIPASQCYLTEGLNLLNCSNTSTSGIAYKWTL